jgi:transposase
MRYVLGIDISARKSNYALISDMGELVSEGNVKNDLEGIQQLIVLIEQYQSEVIFEATGIYSRKLQFSLEKARIEYVMINPLAAKKAMDSLRKTKNDKTDARDLAKIQMSNQYVITKMSASIYRELNYREQHLSNISQDLANSKNRLNMLVEDTFPGALTLYTGGNFPAVYNLLMLFPHANLVNQKSKEELLVMVEGVVKQSRERKVNELMALAQSAAYTEDESSFLVEEVRFYAAKILELLTMKERLIAEMTIIAQQLEEFEPIMSIPGVGERIAVGLIANFGDIKRFTKASQLNAYVGIDIIHHDSGVFKSKGKISKRGNSGVRKLLYTAMISMIGLNRRTGIPNHIADYYERRIKRETGGKKKIIVGMMDRLLRTIFHLVKYHEHFSG